MSRSILMPSSRTVKSAGLIASAGAAGVVIGIGAYSAVRAGAAKVKSFMSEDPGYVENDESTSASVDIDKQQPLVKAAA